MITKTNTVSLKPSIRPSTRQGPMPPLKYAELAAQACMLFCYSYMVIRLSGLGLDVTGDITGDGTWMWSIVLLGCLVATYILHRTKQTIRVWIIGMTTAILLFTVFPFYYAILTSFESGTAIFEVNYLPTTIEFENYISIFSTGSFGSNLINSVITASVVVMLSLVLAVTASYAMSRIKFRGRGLLLLTILSVSMFPQISVLSGLFELIYFFNLFNSVGALIFSYMIFTLPFTVWVLTAFMREIPIELEEAAVMDGASPLRIISKVFLPLLWPSLVTTGLLAFIAAWNEFLFALTFVISDSQRTVPVAIALISGSTAREIPWGNIMAASVIVTVPLVVLVLIFQQKIISGLTAGAIKG